MTARAVERYLEAMGKNMAAFGLDHLDTCIDDELRRTRDIVDALDAPIPEDSSSGIAAANIPSWRTTHLRFKIPLECEVSLACDVPKQSSLAALIIATSLIIWDEASMSKRQNIESLDLLLRDLCDPEQLFGGKIVVFGGDFRQTPPILPRKSQREVVEASLVSSPLWPQLFKFRLTENIRARTDPEFARFLLSLSNGQLQTKEHEYIELPAGLVKTLEASNANPINDLASFAFPELDNNTTLDSSIFSNRAVLTPLNDDVDVINSVLIDKFPGKAVTYTSYDTMLDDNCAVYPAEFINKLNPGGMSPHELVLKENCPVILIRNLQPSFGLCNGTRLICKRFLPNSIECVIMTGQHTGDHVFIPRIKLRPGPSTNYPFQFQRNQFPLKLSFAMTVNKCQGQTLSQVIVYLTRPCFSHGQLYVALSRARKASQVTVFATPGPESVPPTFIKNVVSYDALTLAEII
ncbi:uncharacterized protein LOC141607773 [Silene latifolia]|uniref:uncharacterized protein LOC141607773 n=1 Tax=Silene latifolia TaxID=37657 RepID=UPI003D779429